MKVSSVVRGVLGGAFAFAVSHVHADQMGDLCTIFDTSRNNQVALNRQIANERNPLKQNSLQQQLRQIDHQREASLDAFLRVNHRQFANFTGVISAFRFFNYSNGPGADLSIDLPCKVTIYFQFIDRVGAFGGNPRPEDETPLLKWRTALENVVVGDSVTFSGRFAPNKGISRAVMTELRKKGGNAYKVPDPYLPPTTGTFSKPTVTQGGLIWMPPTFSRNWEAANAYCQGMSGWRLPTQMEVQYLVRSGAINGQGWFSPGYGQAAWTSTSAGPVIHMTVLFQTGDVNTLKDEYEQRVTCVRVADAAPASASAQQPQAARQGQQAGPQANAMSGTLSMPANGDSPRITVPPGHYASLTGVGFLLHTVFTDGRECVYGQTNCGDGPISYMFVRDVSGKANSVTYEMKRTGTR